MPLGGHFYTAANSQNLLAANQQVLASPFLNGQVDLSKVDFKKLEQQMGSIQAEMLKLAGMILQGESNQPTETTNTASEAKIRLQFQTA